MRLLCKTVLHFVPLIFVPLILLPLISIHCSSSSSPSTLPLSHHLPEPAFPVYAARCREKAATWGKRTDADAGRNGTGRRTDGIASKARSRIERPGLAAQTAGTGLHRSSFSCKQVAVGRGAVLTRLVENKEENKVKHDVQYCVPSKYFNHVKKCIKQFGI